MLGGTAVLQVSGNSGSDQDSGQIAVRMMGLIYFTGDAHKRG